MTWRTLARLSVLSSGLVLVFWNAMPASAAGGGPPKLRPVSADPFTNATSQHHTEVEADTAAAGSTVVSVFQAGRFVNGGGSSGIGFATSHDAGRTWTSGALPGLTVATSPPGTYARATDVVAAFDARHSVWLVSALTCRPPDCDSAPDSITVNRSTSGGVTWSAASTIFTDGFLDHPWLACDDTASSTFYGRCYVSTVDFTTSKDETMRSDDGGVTWAGPFASMFLPYLQSIVQPNGTYVIVGGGAAAERSIDGATTFGAPAPISLHQSHAVTGMRTLPVPSVTEDGAGTLYVYWQDCRFRAGCAANDIVYSTSSDAVTWSPVTRIPIDGVTSGVDHFIPGLGVDPATHGATAHLALTYYYLTSAACTFPSPDTCRLDVGFTTSLDGGKKWSKAHPLTHHSMDLGWLANTNIGRMVGDYLSTAFAGGHTISVLAIASAPAGGAFNEGMDAAVG